MSKQHHIFGNPPPGYVCFSVGLIYDRKMIRAGELVPLSMLKEIPPNLRRDRFIVKHDPHYHHQANGEPRPLNFQLGTHYGVDDAGDRYHQKQLEQEVVNLQAAQEEQAYWEERLSAEPDEQIKAALEDARNQEEAVVQRQIAEGQALARERELADQAAREVIAEEDRETAGITDSTHMVSPDVSTPDEWHPESKLKRVLKTRYVERDGHYLRARKVPALKVSEKVYVKEGSEFVVAGKVNRHKKLPLIWKD